VDVGVLHDRPEEVALRREVGRERQETAKGLGYQHDPSVGVEQEQGFVGAIRDSVRDG
jgi:hypothetical protein